MNAWSRYKKERRENNYCLIQGSRAERHTKTQVIKRLASPHTSFGVRSSRIHFSPTSVGERWMRDERTSKDVWGEAIKRYAGIRFKQSRAVNPQRLQILRIDREGMKRHDVICAEKKKRVKKMLLELYHLTWSVYFQPITLSLILQWHTGVCNETLDIY